MIEIKCPSGGELLSAGVAALQDCRHDLPLAGRLALVNHADERSGVAGDGLSCTITTVFITTVFARQRHIAMVALRARVFTWSFRILNIVIPRGFISRGWGLKACSLRIFIANSGIANRGIANSGAIAHDRSQQLQIGGWSNAITEEMRASATGPVRGGPRFGDDA